MKNKKKIIFIIIIAILAIVVITEAVLIYRKKTEIEETNKEYALKFKESYEALNNTIRESDNELYNTVDISEDNPIVYVGLEELVDIVNNEKEAYIYISSPDCPYCRASIGSLLDAARDLKIKKIYYYDIDNADFDMSDEKLDELENQLVEKGILKTNSEGKVRWSMPLVAKVREGEVVAKQTGTDIDYNEGQTKNSPLTDEQKQKLYDVYYELLSK